MEDKSEAEDTVCSLFLIATIKSLDIVHATLTHWGSLETDLSFCNALFKSKVG